MHHVVVIVERFAAAHKHDVGDLTVFDAAALRRVDGDDLSQDFGKSQVADEPVPSRRAESAVHPAPYLRGHAKRVAVVVRHKHPFDEVAVGKTEKILFAAVARGIDFEYSDGIGHELFGHFGAQGF